MAACAGVDGDRDRAILRVRGNRAAQQRKTRQEETGMGLDGVDLRTIDTAAIRRVFRRFRA
jgi:hypothetical protein